MKITQPLIFEKKFDFSNVKVSIALTEALCEVLDLDPTTDPVDIDKYTDTNALGEVITKSVKVGAYVEMYLKVHGDVLYIDSDGLIKVYGDTDKPDDQLITR